MKQTQSKNKTRYSSPEIHVIEFDREDILTTSGDIKEGVGVQWNWNFENTFDEPFNN